MHSSSVQLRPAALFAPLFIFLLPAPVQTESPVWKTSPSWHGHQRLCSIIAGNFTSRCKASTIVLAWGGLSLEYMHYINSCTPSLCLSCIFVSKLCMLQSSSASKNLHFQYHALLPASLKGGSEEIVGDGFGLDSQQFSDPDSLCGNIRWKFSDHCCSITHFSDSHPYPQHVPNIPKCLNGPNFGICRVLAEKGGLFLPLCTRVKSRNDDGWMDRWTEFWRRLCLTVCLNQDQSSLKWALQTVGTWYLHKVTFDWAQTWQVVCGLVSLSLYSFEGIWIS